MSADIPAVLANAVVTDWTGHVASVENEFMLLILVLLVPQNGCKLAEPLAWQSKSSYSAKGYIDASSSLHSSRHSTRTKRGLVGCTKRGSQTYVATDVPKASV